MNKRASKKLLDELEFLFERYSRELRVITQPYTLAKVQKHVKDYRYHPDDPLVCETHMEHIGSLPIAATALYPYLDDRAVDLGRALTMLAIHDIGELITGDQLTFTKKTGSKAAERAAALRLLHPSLKETYLEIDTLATPSAKFAKAVDKLVPDFIDYLTRPDLTIWRYKHSCGVGPDGIIDLIVKHKRPYMLWNPFMTQFHEFLMSELARKLKKK